MRARSRRRLPNRNLGDAMTVHGADLERPTLELELFADLGDVAQLVEHEPAKVS